MSRVSRAIFCCFSGFRCSSGAHVVQAVGELDEHNADVRNHGEQHLADVLCLMIFTVRKLDPVELGDTLDDVGDLPR